MVRFNVAIKGLKTEKNLLHTTWSEVFFFSYACHLP